MEPLLNRWRGTGVVFTVLGFGITGANVYAVYMGLLFGFVTGSWAVGMLTVVGFRIGESFGWGKWVGSLCYPENVKLPEFYEDKEGYKFPYIHYIANSVIKEKKDYYGYCRVALGLRGAVWAMCVYAGLVGFGFIGIGVFTAAVLAWGIGFPLACWLGSHPMLGGENSKSYEGKIARIVGKWEKQEVVYGVIHMLTNILVVCCVLV